MEISDRISTAIKMVTSRGVVADIGCDHCLSLISLITNGKCEKGIGTDIKKGPLEKAKQNVSRYGVGGKIELRLGDGLTAVSKGEADAFIIAGMGGAAISTIINKSLPVAKSASELIVQPHSDVDAVRKNLHKNGFKIEDEKMIFERGKFYVTIRAAVGNECYTNDAHYLYGKLLINKKCPVLKQFLLEQLQKNMHIINSLQNISTKNCNIKAAELDDEIGLIKEVVKCL